MAPSSGLQLRAPRIPPSLCIPSPGSSHSARLLQRRPFLAQLLTHEHSWGLAKGSSTLPAFGHCVTLVLPDSARVPEGSGASWAPPKSAPPSSPMLPMAHRPGVLGPPPGALCAHFLYTACFSFQCYKVSCLEIPGPPGPKGYRGQKVSRPDRPRGQLPGSPDLSSAPDVGPRAPGMTSALLILDELKFSFYLPLKWHFEKSRDAFLLLALPIAAPWQSKEARARNLKQASANPSGAPTSYTLTQGV